MIKCTYEIRYIYASLNSYISPNQSCSLEMPALDSLAPPPPHVPFPPFPHHLRMNSNLMMIAYGIVFCAYADGGADTLAALVLAARRTRFDF